MGDGAQAGTGNKFTADLMDQFFRDPNMQQLLYKYLPEPMRNPQTFEWMLSNPEYRKQLEGMMEQQVSLLGKLTACLQAGQFLKVIGSPTLGRNPQRLALPVNLRVSVHETLLPSPCVDAEPLISSSLQHPGW
jgi:hypothetical protein